MQSQWIDKTNERFLFCIRFINWMRVAATPNFKKLWGRVNTDILQGNYTINIKNNFPTSLFGGDYILHN
jgi:hypothetical protein